MSQFHRLIDQFEWEDSDAVKTLIKEAIYIEEIDGKKVKTGNSKFGGTPDLPAKISWPKFGNKSMQFFAQINLSEISDLHRDELLPKKGILYFFAYFPAPSGAYGAEYDFRKNKDEYSIIYFDGTEEELKPSDFPIDIPKEYKFQSKGLSFETIFQLPATWETGVVEYSSLSQFDRDQLFEFNNMTDDGILDQILGHPVPVQYGVDYDWAVSYLGKEIENNEHEKRKAELEAIRPEFVNLLTFPLFRPIGDSQVYVGILKEDLKNKDFEKAVFIMQDT